MASQAWEQFKTSRITRTTLTWLIIGILVGLLLGLLIGWVWWPVEYKEPVTPATLTAPATGGIAGASADAVALYMGATADAYAYASRAGDTEAVSAAAQRLAALGGTVADNFDTAIAYYSAQANGAATAANLRELATAVGVTTGAAAGTGAASDAGASGAAGDAAAASAPAAAAPQATGAETRSGWGLGNFIAGLLAAGLLIAGGGYIFYMLRRQRELGGAEPMARAGSAASEETAPAFADEPAATTVTTSSTTTFTRNNLTPPPGTAATVTTTAWPRQAQPGVEGGFDRDVEEGEAEEDDAPVVVRGRPSGGYGPLGESDLEPASDEDGVEDGYAEDDETGDDGGIEPWEEGPPDPRTGSGARPAAAPGLVTAVGSTPPVSGPRTPPVDPAASASPPAAPAAPAAPTLSTLQPPPPSRVAGAQPIASFKAEYVMGMDAFDFAEDIKDPSDPTGNTYIGEFGMAIPENKGMLNHDLSKVIAFDVWLFDKTDERQIQTLSRSLLSNYASDKKYEEYQRQKPNLTPVVAQPGLNFPLEAQQLVLDCTVRDVTYTSDGTFRKLVMDLVVKRKQ